MTTPKPRGWLIRLRRLSPQSACFTSATETEEIFMRPFSTDHTCRPGTSHKTFFCSLAGQAAFPKLPSSPASRSGKCLDRRNQPIYSTTHCLPKKRLKKMTGFSGHSFSPIVDCRDSTLFDCWINAPFHGTHGPSHPNVFQESMPCSLLLKQRK